MCSSLTISVTKKQPLLQVARLLPVTDDSAQAKRGPAVIDAVEYPLYLHDVPFPQNFDGSSFGLGKLDTEKVKPTSRPHENPVHRRLLDPTAQDSAHAVAKPRRYVRNAGNFSSPSRPAADVGALSEGAPFEWRNGREHLEDFFK